MNFQLESTLVDALGELRRHARPLLQALVLPALLIAGLETLDRQLDLHFLISLLYKFLVIFGYALFAVSCHRIILLGPESLPNRLGLYATGPVWRYFAAMLVFFVIGMMGILLITPFVWPFLLALEGGAAVLAGLIFGVLLVVGVFLAMSRVVLLFPSISVESDCDVNDIIELSAPCWGRLAGVTFLSGLIVGLAGFPLSWMAMSSDRLLASITLSFLACLLGAYGVTAISCAYRAIVRDLQATAGGTPD